MKEFNVAGIFNITEDLMKLDRTVSVEDFQKVFNLKVHEQCYISFGFTKNATVTRIK